jgi:hypothetical protein
VRELDQELHDHLTRRYLLAATPDGGPRPDPCLTCPPLDVIENHLLGGVVRATMDVVRPVRDAIERGERPEVDLEGFERAWLGGAANGYAELAATLERSLRQTRALFKAELAGAPR